MIMLSELMRMKRQIRLLIKQLKIIKNDIKMLKKEE